MIFPTQGSKPDLSQTHLKYSFFFSLGKKWIYLERNTLHRQSVGHLRRSDPPKYGVASFYGLSNFIGKWVGRLFQLIIIPTIILIIPRLFQLFPDYFGGRGRDFQELGHCPLFGLSWLASEPFKILWYISHHFDWIIMIASKYCLEFCPHPPGHKSRVIYSVNSLSIGCWD